MPKSKTRSILASSASGADAADVQFVLRPDGYYWCAARSRQEVGPFASVEEAEADWMTADGEAPEPGETLQEAESELGLSDWIDPDTGGLSEGLSAPRLDG